MHRRPALLAALLALSVPLPAPAAAARKPAPARKATPPARLTARQLLQRHLAARGGLAAWRAVQTMAWRGEMDVGYGDSAPPGGQRVGDEAAAHRGKAPQAAPAESRPASREQVQVPFVLELKRPAKARVEIQFAGKWAVQVYDGKSGWMFRPFLNRDDWVPFSPEQAAQQRGLALEDPLMEAAAKGTAVRLVTRGRVDGRDAYELELSRGDGSLQHVWIDARTFLDVKIEGTPRRMDGTLHAVWVTQRDFRRVSGLVIPFVLETSVAGYPDAHRVVVEKVALNPRLDDARFTRPRT